MSANDRNEKFADKNDRYAMDNEAAPDGAEGELSQDELNNVSGGLRILKDPAGASNAEGGIVT